MSIRDELINMGYDDEYVNEVALSAYTSVASSLPRRKTILDTKFVKALTTDWIEVLVDKLALYYYEKEKEKDDKPEFMGDRTNPIDVYEYNAMNGIMPNETTQNEDGSYTHRYDDTEITVKINISSIVPEGFFENYEIRRKRLIAFYLHMEEDILLAMSDEEIEELVKKNERNKKKNNRLLQLQ